jgi:beta-1,4-mannosyltransferase
MARREAFSLVLQAMRAAVTGRPGRAPARRSGGTGVGTLPSTRRPDATRPASGDLTAEVTAGRAVVATAPGPPLALGYYPTVTTNPFQTLLYDRALEQGIIPLAVRVEWQLAELEQLQRSGLATILHLHWLHPVMRSAASVDEARAMARAFLARLDGYRAAGGRLVWTVHNVLPHESRFDAEEARLCAEVASRANVVHVLARRTAELVKPWYELPAERLLHVPLPSYAAVYPDHVSRLEARQWLRLQADDLVYLMLGAIRPYKDVHGLLEAWARIDPAGRRLVIAGPATDEPGVATLIDRARATPGVSVEPRKIPVTDMQVFLRAADVAVLPHPGALNSGALMLALTFGLPAIVPAGTGLADEVDEAFARLYAPGSVESLAEALMRVAELATPEARAAALGATVGRSPAEISRRFAGELYRRLGGGG